MNATGHAKTRSQQRAIPEMMVDLLLQFGASENAGSGARKMFFDKTSRRRVKAYAGVLADLLDAHMNLYVVAGLDMQVITVGHRLERIHRH